MTTDEKYMKQAIKQAKKAYAIDEVPIGCIIVRDEDGKAGRLHDVCDAGTLSDVRRCPGAVTDRPRGDREHEPESRLCRIGIESASDRRI